MIRIRQLHRWKVGRLELIFAKKYFGIGWYKDPYRKTDYFGNPFGEWRWGTEKMIFEYGDIW